jgi:hypothetical protein
MWRKTEKMRKKEGGGTELCAESRLLGEEALRRKRREGLPL